MLRQVPVVPLVERLEAEKVGGGSLRGGGAAPLPEHRRGVIMQVEDRVLPDIGLVNQDIMLRNGGGQLQIAVGDGTLAIGRGLQGALDGKRETLAPKEGVVRSPIGSGHEENAPHSSTRSVAGTQSGRRSRDGLGNAGGAAA